MWELRFFYDKCQLLQVGYSDPRVYYHLGNHVITQSDAVCDLGVNIHSSLKLSFHISIIVRKANISSKLILKCFLSRNPDNFIRAFSFVLLKFMFAPYWCIIVLYGILGFYKILI